MQTSRAKDLADLQGKFDAWTAWIDEYNEKFEPGDLSCKILETALRNMLPQYIVDNRVAGRQMSYEEMKDMVEDLLADHRDHRGNSKNGGGSGLDEMRMGAMQRSGEEEKGLKEVAGEGEEDLGALVGWKGGGKGKGKGKGKSKGQGGWKVGQGKSGGCFTCGGPHGWRECPKNDGYGGQPKGQPKGDSRGNAKGKGGWSGGLKGKAKGMGKTGRSNPFIICYNCGRSGHPAFVCNQEWLGEMPEEDWEGWENAEGEVYEDVEWAEDLEELSLEMEEDDAQP